MVLEPRKSEVKVLDSGEGLGWLHVMVEGRKRAGTRDSKTNCTHHIASVHSSSNHFSQPSGSSYILTRVLEEAFKP